MGIRVRLCSDWCLREADGESDYPQTSVSCIVRTQYPYFAQRYAGITGFGPILVLLLNFYLRKKEVCCQTSFLTTRMGFEPTTSAVTGRRSNQLSHQAIL